MKKVLFLAALVLGIASCQKDFTAENESRGEVSVQLSVAAPELIGATRTDGDAQKFLDSAYGAIDYLDGAPVGDDRWDWNNVDLRYSMEVYDETDLTTPVKDRMVIIKDKYEPVTFELRLIPGREYRFVVFADFVPNGEAAKTVDYNNQADLGLRHYIDGNLTKISIKQDADADAINDEIADAYFEKFTYTPSSSSSNKADDVVLKRPYGKVRVVATDLADLNLNVEPKYVEITYINSVVPTTFNAVEGTVGTEKSNKIYGYELVDNIRDNRASHVYNAGYDALVTKNVYGEDRASHLTLFTDYILATDTHSPISFQMTVYDDAAHQNPIKTVDFNTNIPIQRNHLTTIIGNVMTANTEFTVTIDDNFANADDVEKEPWYMEIWDGKSQTEPEVTVDQATGETVAIIDQPSDLAWLAAYVNGTLETPSTFATRAAQQINFVLAANIDLGNQPWTPIGTEENNFVGIFDGNGYSISNLNIVEAEAKEGKAYMGFFGYAKNATIKNVVFQNVYVNIPCLDIDHSQGHIGAVVGSLEGTSTIENVTVKGDVKVEATTTANGASRVAVVAGGNSYGNVTMKNVHVVANEGSYLKANNNVGALAGQLQGKCVFEDCSSNIDVTGTKFFAGGIIGLAAGDQVFTNCHTTGNITITAGREGRGHDHYRVGGIAGGWSDGAKNVCTLNGCSYTGELSGTNADGSVVDVFDYAGYVGRGYTLNGCQGSKVVIDGVEYVQAYNTAAEAGIYYVNGELILNNAAALKLVASKVNNGVDYFEGVTVKLGANIDLNNEEWAPIGSAYADHGFMGNFDGNGFVVKNLKMTELALDADNYAYAGFFGVTEGTDKDNQNYIKNLTIENVTISTEGHIAAAAVAYPYYTALENIKVQGDVSIKGGDYTSGVLAYTRRCVDAKNISIEAKEGSVIEGNKTIGGVISDIQMNGGLTANYSNFKAENLTIKGVMNVGGISGIISKQTLNGATVKNVTIVCDDVRKGIVAGSLGDKSAIENVVYENVTGATRIIGATYGDGAIVVANANDLIEALENGKDVYLFNDITIDPANMSNAYGKTGINVKNGQTINGGGHTLNINGAGGTWDSGIATTGGLIKNLTVTGSFRGIFIKSGEYTEKVVLENVTITGTTYTISCDQGKYQGIEAKNCTFNGWTSFAKTAGEAKFVNCSFGEGSGYKYCRPYSNTEFVGCTFCPGYTVDTTRATITFTDCIWEE